MTRWLGHLRAADFGWTSDIPDDYVVLYGIFLDLGILNGLSHLAQAGRVLSSKAVLNLPLALRQEAEVWHSRQEERPGHLEFSRRLQHTESSPWWLSSMKCLKGLTCFGCRLNLAKSMEAVVDRASSLEEAAGEALLTGFVHLWKASFFVFYFYFYLMTTAPTLLKLHFFRRWAASKFICYRTWFLIFD